MMKGILQWLAFVLVASVLSACGGGGGGASNPPDTSSATSQTTLKSDTVLVDQTQAAQIISTTAPDDGRTELSISGELAQSLVVGKKFLLPPGADDRFPLGLAGKIDEVVQNSNGTGVVLSSVTLADVMEESYSPKREVPLRLNNFVGVIAPSAVQPSSRAKLAARSAASVNQISALNGGVTFTESTVAAKSESIFDDGLIEIENKLNLDLELPIKDMGDDPSTIKPYGTGAEAKVTVSGSFQNIKLIESHDVSATDGLNSMRFEVVGDLSFEAKLSGGAEVALGYYSQAWKEVEEEQIKLLGASAKLTGLSSKDKIGKYPFAGLVFSLECPPSGCPVQPGNTQTPVRQAKDLGLILWVYINSKGELKIDGAIGARINAGELNIGLKKDAGQDFDFLNSLTAKTETSATKLIEAPFVEGELDLTYEFGLSLDADLFLSGVRFANAGVDLGERLHVNVGGSGSFSTAGLNKPWSWDGGVCFAGNLGAGAIFSANVNAGVKVDTKFFDVNADYSLYGQWPSESAISQPGLHGTWYTSRTLQQCYPQPVVSKVETTVDNGTAYIGFFGKNLPADLSLTITLPDLCTNVVPVAIGGDQIKRYSCKIKNPATQFWYNLSSNKAQNLDLSSVSTSMYYINYAPVANAGDDKTINEGGYFSANGSGIDQDNDALTYSWKQVGGISVTLLNPTTPGQLAFSAPSVASDEVLEFELTVTDNKGATGKDTVKITVKNLPPGNQPPVANAGSDQTVEEGKKVYLMGKTSNDPDGSIVSYKWRQLSGASVTLDYDKFDIAEFVAPQVDKETSLIFELTVTDNKGATASDTVTITVQNATAENQPPVSNAGSGFFVNEEATIILNGDASYDPDGEVAQYLWTQVAGIGVNIVDADKSTAQVKLPNVTKDTVFTFVLTVTDDKGATGVSEVNITVMDTPNQPPVANAGIDQEIVEGKKVVLNGTASSDPDGSIVSYKWEQVAGDGVTLQGDNTSTAEFVAPLTVSDDELEFELIVTDDKGATAFDRVKVLVRNSPNQPPVANAGIDQEIVEGNKVVLNGTASSDPDGSIVSYKWEQVVGDGVTLQGDNTSTAEFVAPLLESDEELEFELTVTDDKGATASDRVKVLVKNIVVVQPTPTGKLNDTGITLCGDYAFDTSGNTISGHTHSNSQDCNLLSDAEGDPIPPTLRMPNTGQDGHVGRDVTHNDDSDGHAGFSFTKIGVYGEKLPANATEWSCVKDNVTGLIWETKTADYGLHNRYDQYTWYEPNDSKNGGFPGLQNDDYGSCYGYNATDSRTYCNTYAYVNRVNEVGLCGAKDWRIPTNEELHSIINYPGRVDSGSFNLLDNDWFSSVLNITWSATPTSSSVDGAWVVFMDDGYVLPRLKLSRAGVILVRGDILMVGE